MSFNNHMKDSDNDSMEVVQEESLKLLLQALKDGGPRASSISESCRDIPNIFYAAEDTTIAREVNWQGLHSFARNRLPLESKPMYFCAPLSERKRAVQPMYSTVRTFVQWSGRDSNVKGLILTPKGCCRDGSCCVLLDREVCVQVMLFAKECDVPKLIHGLEKTAHVPWRRVTQIARLPERMIDPVRVLLQAKGCHHVVDELNELVWLSADETLALPEPILPDGIRLRELTVDDSLRLATNWPHAGKDAVYLITDIIRFNGGLGAQDERGELLGHVLFNHFGGLGQLFVYPGHRRKGVGRLLAVTMCKKIAKIGDLVTVNIITKNSSSINLFRSLNFRHGFFNVYIQVVRHDDTTPK